jgi:putative addiction module component (TIGR02574 family)
VQPSDLDTSSLTMRSAFSSPRDQWDGVAAQTDELPPSAAQVAELDRRLADFEPDPDTGESWEVVRARIEQRLAEGR